MESMAAISVLDGSVQNGRYVFDFTYHLVDFSKIMRTEISLRQHIVLSPRHRDRCQR